MGESVRDTRHRRVQIGDLWPAGQENARFVINLREQPPVLLSTKTQMTDLGYGSSATGSSLTYLKHPS